MQSDQNFYNRNAVPPLSYQVGGGYINAPMAPTLPPSAKPLRPFNGVELQPFEVCPKNFIIVDQTDNRSRIMFHPALAEKFNYPDFDIQDNGRMKDTGTENRESSYPMKEDTGDINVLLSLDDEEEEEEEEEEEDEEEVSTARTLGSSGSSSPDSCSMYGSKPSKVRLSSSIQNSFSCSSSSSERKRQKMKEMMKALRGIVPGADQMNSAAVLDEAVKYLKSLKVEVKKLGIGNLNV